MDRRAMLQAVHVGHAAETSEPGTADFVSLFRDHFGYVWNSLRRLGVREADLDDVSHDLFLLVHRHLSEYDTRRPARPWLFAFAVRVASDYRRLARHRIRLAADLGSVADPHPLADEWVVRREAQDATIRALERLTWERRVIFVLHEVDGVPIPESAEILGIPVNTAYSRLRLARQDFAKAVRHVLKGGSAPHE